ncbi:SH3 domain-containing protein, partial [Klebsiella pneumoniae]|nr:SH3 domain-containing protein [Klebsiella pneumoniae]
MMKDKKTSLKNHDSLLTGTATINIFRALTQNSVANAFLKNHDSLLTGTAASKAFGTLTQNSIANAFLKN